jgi:hypothetical protein
MSETLDAPQIDTPAEAPAPDAADDLRAALGAAFDQHSDPETERDESGRFVSREREATDVIDHETPVDETQAEAKPDAEAQAAEETRPAMPAEMAPIKQVLDDYAHLYRAKGVAPEAAVKALFDAEVALRSRPDEAFPALAQAFGFDIMKWAAQRMPATQNEQAQTAPADPAYQALVAKVQQLESHLTAQQQRSQQAQTAQVERMVAEFAADPKHAHFASVEPLMAAFIEKGQAKDLEAAYEMACRAHPDVFKTIQQSEAAAKEKASLDAQRKAAAQAKAKAGSVRGSATVAGIAKPPDDLRGTLNAVWDGRLN